MASKSKRSRGRPPGGEYPEKSSVINFRIRPDTKQLLQEAANASGRTLSQESEHQLRRALIEMGAGPTYAFMQIIGRVVDKLVNLKDPNAKWMHDLYLYRQARNAIIAALDLFQPEGTPPESTAESLDFGGTQQGALMMKEELRDVQLADPSIPIAKQSARQRRLSAEKTDLGVLADRPRIYGKTAEQIRQEAPPARQLAALIRKAQRNPEQMTDADRTELEQLLGVFDEIRKAVKPASKGGKR
jgi:hypothetical protein